MVNKRKISIAVLLAVNLVMLLHAILPHHHHEDEVCFSESHCADTPVIIDLEGAGEMGHGHDLPGNDQNCGVNHTYLVPDLKGNNLKSELNMIFRHSIVSILIPEVYQIDLHFAIRILFQAITTGISSLISGSSLSLRAPPEIA